MKKSFRSALIAGALAVCSAQASATLVESFDTGAWGAGWSNLGAGTVNASAAHDGAFGVTLNGTSFTYNTSMAIAPGEKLSAWARPSLGSSGRIYLGFGASAAGTQSFVAATNTSQVIFQDNSGFAFNNLSAASQVFANHWYLMEVDWTGVGTATGNLFDSDGTTLLNSISVAGLPFGAGGISLRGFGGWDVDTISITSNSVPEPGSLALLALGLVSLGASRRKKLA